MRRDLELLDACARGEIPGAVRLYGFEPACLSLGRMQADRRRRPRRLRPRRGRRRASPERWPCGAARPGGDLLRGVPVDRPGLRRTGPGVVLPDPRGGRGWTAGARRAHRSLARCRPTSGGMRARAPRLPIASPARRRMSCSTIGAESSSAAPRPAAPARCCSTVRCCWSRRAQRGTSVAALRFHRAALGFAKCWGAS